MMDPSNSLVLVFSTVPDRDSGLRIGRALVEERLVACANLLPGLTSVYRWEGEVHADEEQLLIMKARRERVPELSERITLLHPYDVPEVIAVPIEGGSASYCRWVLDETAEVGR